MLEDKTKRAAPSRDGETEDMLPARGAQSPPTIHRVNRRPLGIGPVPLLGGGLFLALVLAVVLVAVGAWPAGILLLACAVVLVALLLVAVDREPEDPAAQAATLAADRARSKTRLIGVAARAWSRAGLAVVRFRQRRYHLRWRLRRQLQPLGEAAYRGDEERVEALRSKARQMEDALRQAERDTAAAVEAARVEIERERGFSQPTQSLPVQDPPDATA